MRAYPRKKLLTQWMSMVRRDISVEVARVRFVMLVLWLLMMDESACSAMLDMDSGNGGWVALAGCRLLDQNPVF
jgi:hypothetical protein